jgi:hypothetical protein
MSPTGGYRYYRLLGISGNTSNSPYLYEAEFKINDASAGTSEYKLQTFKSGVALGQTQLQPDGGTVTIGSTPAGSNLDSVLVKDHTDGENNKGCCAIFINWRWCGFFHLCNPSLC